MSSDLRLFDTETLAAARGPLTAMPVEVRARELQRIAGAWLDGSYEPRRKAEGMIRYHRGHSLPVIRKGLDHLFSGITEEALLAWWHRRGGDRMEPPRLAAVLPAWNIPGVGILPVLVCLFAGVPVVARVPVESMFMVFLSSLRDLSPVLGDATAVHPWDRNDREKEAALLGRADRILVFGSDETISLLESRYPGRVRGHGTSISVAFVGRESIGPDAARAMAVDIAMWDQHGCLSPQAVFVEGDFRHACVFAEHLSSAMERIQADLPARQIPVQEAAMLRTRRAEIETSIVAGENVRFWSPGRSLVWSVVAWPDSRFRSGIDRMTPVLPIPRLEDVSGALRPLRQQLLAAGIAVCEARREAVTRLLCAAGFDYVTDLGTMQLPPIDWPNKGSDLLQDILEDNPPGRQAPLP